MKASVPIGFAALCGVMCERSGVVNIGIEGTMLVAAFVGWTAGVYLVPVLGSEPSAALRRHPDAAGRARPGDPGRRPRVARPRLVIDLGEGGPDHQRHDHQHRRVRDHRLPDLAAVDELARRRRPVQGVEPAGRHARPAGRRLAVRHVPRARARSRSVCCVIVIAFQIALFRTRWGLRSRAVGEHPRAAETVGIDVIRLRYRNVMLGGVLAGLGGAFLSMEATAAFQPGHDRGKGFIGLAAMIVGRWTPLGAFGAALLFASIGRASASRSSSRRRRASSATSLDLAAAAVLRRAAVPRDDHHPGRRRRPEHPAGRRRPAVRARGRDLTREERDRAAAFLDLQEGRGPVAVLDDAGIERVLRATRRIAVIGASSDPDAAVIRRAPDAGRPGPRLRAGEPERARGPRAAGLPGPRRGGRGDRPGRHGRRLPAVGPVRAPRASRLSPRVPASCGCSSAWSTGKRPGSPAPAGSRS